MLPISTKFKMPWDHGSCLFMSLPRAQHCTWCIRFSHVIKTTECDAFPSICNITPYKGLNKMKKNSCWPFFSSLNLSIFFFPPFYLSPSLFPSFLSFLFQKIIAIFLELGRQQNVVKNKTTWTLGFFRFNQLCLSLTSGIVFKGLQWWLSGKYLPASAGDTEDADSISE